MASGHAWWLEEQNAWVIKPDRGDNLQHIERVNGGTSGIPIEYEFPDPRQATPQQRALFFALLKDIYNWSGESVEFLKEWFYAQYTVETLGGVISLSDRTKSTVSDANKLIDIVIDFIFRWDVPIADGYKLLPRDEARFVYRCALSRKCVICGKHADLHHLDGSVVGMGMNRNKVNHTERELYPLCRKHHQAYHTLGEQGFENKYHVHVKGVKLTADELRKLGVRGNYETIL